MSDHTIVARPYAKAVFEIARAQNSLSQWAEALALASSVVEDEGFNDLLFRPDADPQALADLVIDICGERAGELQQNLIRLLAGNGRLTCLPWIAAEYVRLRDEYENVADVEVLSAVPLSEEQKEQFAGAMKKRLGKDVRLSCDIDASLLGGAILRSGDIVIDGSLRGRLDRLAGALTH